MRSADGHTLIEFLTSVERGTDVYINESGWKLMDINPDDDMEELLGKISTWGLNHFSTSRALKESACGVDLVTFIQAVLSGMGVQCRGYGGMWHTCETQGRLPLNNLIYEICANSLSDYRLVESDK